MKLNYLQVKHLNPPSIIFREEIVSRKDLRALLASLGGIKQTYAITS